MTVSPEQLARALVIRRRAESAARLRQTSELHRTVRALARKLPTGATAWLIGSLASGTFGEHSDVDVVLRGIARDRIAELWGEWSQQLGVPLDLLRFEDLSPSFQTRVLEEGVVVS